MISGLVFTTTAKSTSFTSFPFLCSDLCLLGISAIADALFSAVRHGAKIMNAPRSKFMIVLAIALLAITPIACVRSYNPWAEQPKESILLVADNAIPTPAPTVTIHETMPVTRELCVISDGLWLRNAPDVADNNKLLALPRNTRVTVVSPGEWSRVYLRPNDLYGYVKSQYLGACQHD